MKQFFSILALVLTATLSFAQVGIGTETPDASSILDLTATDKGFLPPQLTSAQREAISSPASGLTIYNTTDNCLQWYNGVFWFDGCTGSIALPVDPARCLPITTEVVEIVSPTGRIWMDRNLGAYRQAISSTDQYAYGDLYQHGRPTDGHQCRLSPTTSTQSPTQVPGHGDFITTQPWYSGPPPGLLTFWYTTPQNTTAGPSANIVCPTGYRLPTQAEWDAEIATWTGTDKAQDAWANLRLTLSGSRSVLGNIIATGNRGIYHSQTTGTGVRVLILRTESVTSDTNASGTTGYSVRCIKN